MNNLMIFLLIMTVTLPSIATEFNGVTETNDSFHQDTIDITHSTGVSPEVGNMVCAADPGEVIRLAKNNSGAICSPNCTITQPSITSYSLGRELHGKYKPPRFNGDLTAYCMLSGVETSSMTRYIAHERDETSIDVPAAVSYECSQFQPVTKYIYLTLYPANGRWRLIQVRYNPTYITLYDNNNSDLITDGDTIRTQTGLNLKMDAKCSELGSHISTITYVVTGN